MSRKIPRWFRPADRSPRFCLDRATGRIAPPDRVAGADGAADAGAGERLVLYASGDIIWERDLMAFMLDRPPEHPFGEVRAVWSGGDIVFGQLETCFGEERAEHIKYKRISYLTDPRLVPHFVAGGFNLACLASNHTMDNGLAPIEFTKRALTEHGIAVSGSGANLAAAREPAWVEARGYRVALCSYATADTETVAGEELAGNAPFKRELVIEDVRAARAAGADFVLVSVHKGREFVDFPHPDHQADCRAIVDAGADVILGHHPHFQHGIEWRRRPDGRQAVIFYSLGSLLVDYEPPLSDYELGLFERSQRNNYVARVELDGEGVAGLQLTPVRQTDDWSVRLETDEEAETTWDFAEWTSHPVNHEGLCRKFWVTGWPYLAMQYPAIWMHLKKHPLAYGMNTLHWLFREEVFRLHWGTLFARDVPGWLLGLRRGTHAAILAPVRLLKRVLGR